MPFNTEQRRALNAKRRQAGLCVSCEAPSPVFKRCEPCRAIHSPRVVKPVVTLLPRSRFVPPPKPEFEVMWSGASWRE